METKTPKKNYNKPHLKCHGSLKEITKATGEGPGGDGGVYKPSGP